MTARSVESVAADGAPVVLDVANVGIHRSDGVAIAESVSLQVRPGEIVGIVGETGAGKTLVTRAICGLLPHGLSATGEVAFQGVGTLDLKRQRGLRSELGRKVSVVLQNPHGMFDPLLRVRSQLIEGPVRHGMHPRDEAQRRACAVLESLGFADPERVMHAYPHELSGGMAQRVAIAMALLPQPSLLVVDEPTSALDAHVRVEVLELLRDAGRRLGAGTVLISHDLALVGRYCDRLHVLYAGHVVEAGPTAVVLGDPAHPYTELLLSAELGPSSAHRGRLPVIGGAPPQPGAWPTGCVFAPRCPKVSTRALEQRPEVRRQGSRIARCFEAFTEHDGERRTHGV
jgi:oligopeptide/dipeptide ABC transporter ATP-binding protein